jgi:hypothetical protein
MAFVFPVQSTILFVAVPFSLSGKKLVWWQQPICGVNIHDGPFGQNRFECGMLPEGIDLYLYPNIMIFSGYVKLQF